MPMQPSPSAETFRPLLPNSLCSIKAPLWNARADVRVSEIITPLSYYPTGGARRKTYGEAEPQGLRPRVGVGRVRLLRARVVVEARGRAADARRRGARGRHALA